MKRIVLAATLLLVVSNLFAQWKVTGIDKSENSSCELVQILDGGKSTFIFGTITNPSDSLYPYSTISRSTCVYVGDEKYKLLNAVNLPIFDEATPVCARISGGQKLNFILEFEKFPVTDNFDLVEKESKHTEGTYNFYGIHVANAGIQNMVGDSFLDEYPSVLYGSFTNQGKATQYYIAQGLTISCTYEIEQRDLYGKPDYVFFLTFENESGKDIELHPEKDFRVTGHTFKSNGKEDVKEIKLVRQNKLEDYFHGKDYQAARQIVNSTVAGITDAASQAKNRTINSDVQGALGFITLVGTLSIDKDVKEYMKAHPSDRPAALKDCTIKAGEKKSGYVGIQTKNVDQYVLHLTLDGYEYIFTWK